MGLFRSSKPWQGYFLWQFWWIFFLNQPVWHSEFWHKEYSARKMYVTFTQHKFFWNLAWICCSCQIKGDLSMLIDLRSDPILAAHPKLTTLILVPPIAVRFSRFYIIVHGILSESTISANWWFLSSMKREILLIPTSGREIWKLLDKMIPGMFAKVYAHEL